MSDGPRRGESGKASEASEPGARRGRRGDAGPRARMEETLAPVRNFFISTADRVRAAHGPPAYARRKRHIEDLEAALLEAALEAREAHRDPPARRRALEEHPGVQKQLREMNRLIVAHNLYYPIEANLRLDPATREQLEPRDGGRPWRPLPAVTLDDIVQRVEDMGSRKAR